MRVRSFLRAIQGLSVLTNAFFYSALLSVYTNSLQHQLIHMFQPAHPASFFQVRIVSGRGGSLPPTELLPNRWFSHREEFQVLGKN